MRALEQSVALKKMKASVLSLRTSGREPTSQLQPLRQQHLQQPRESRTQVVTSLHAAWTWPAAGRHRLRCSRSGHGPWPGGQRARLQEAAAGCLACRCAPGEGGEVPCNRFA